jgi:hypothetical protein
MPFVIVAAAVCSSCLVGAPSRDDGYIDLVTVKHRGGIYLLAKPSSLTAGFGPSLAATPHTA